MAIKKTVEKGLNDQLRKELEASYGYLAMSAYFEKQNLSGFAKWMKTQSDEERAHAMKIYKHIIDRDGAIDLQSLNKPKLKWKSPLDVFQDSLAMEKDNSDSINKLFDLAQKEKDRPAQVMLQWFIEEQVEEEAIVGDLVEKLKMVGKSTDGLLMLDQQVAQREPEE